MTGSPQLDYGHGKVSYQVFSVQEYNTVQRVEFAVVYFRGWREKKLFTHCRIHCDDIRLYV